MAKSQIRPDNYITIQGWMKTELQLKNNRLLLYALLWGFSQDGKSGYAGRQDYLMEWLDCSRSALDNYIKELTGRGLVVRGITGTGQRILRAIRPQKCPNSGHEVQILDIGCPNSGHEVQILDIGCPNSGHGDAQSLDIGCPNSGLPTIYNNIDNNISYSYSSSRGKTTTTTPTLQDIQKYCQETGSRVDPQRFYDYYNLREWQGKDGSIAATDKWQAVLRLWTAKEEKQRDKSGSFDTDDFFEAALKKSYGEH